MSAGAPIGMQYRSDTTAEGTFSYFYFEKNLQGDIVSVYNANGTKLVSYVYDAWGNHTTHYTNGGGSTGAQYNPFRYRGYYYDSDMGFYYLNDRYYDSITGRFLTPDDPSYLGANGDLLSYNLFAYCSNNPVMYVDPTGHSAIVIGLIIGAIVGAALGFGTVAYTDYQDDGQVFNGSVKWYEYAGGTVTGAVLGAGVGGIIGAGGVYLASAVSSTFGKLTTDLFAYTLTGAPLGTWEDYALAFVAGGLTANLGKGLKTIIDIFGRPLATQVTKIGTNRQDGFRVEKCAYDVVTRASTTLMKAPWKSFARGIIRGYWHLSQKGYFN